MILRLRSSRLPPAQSGLGRRKLCRSRDLPPPRSPLARREHPSFPCAFLTSQRSASCLQSLIHQRAGLSRVVAILCTPVPPALLAAEGVPRPCVEASVKIARIAGLISSRAAGVGWPS